MAVMHSVRIAFSGGASMFAPAHRSSSRGKSGHFRVIAFEQLESRHLLSGTPPTVVKVEVAGTAWSEAFVEYLQAAQLGTQGYSIPRGSSAQSASLTWTNIDQIIITFSEDVDVDGADLSLSGINSVAYSFSDFHYDPIAHVAIWTLTAPLDKDRLRLDLDTNGADPVRDLDGNVLDGEWTNNVSTISGNGVAGGDFHFNFNVLPTDVNNSGGVTSFDYVYIRQLEGKSTTSSGYIAKRDVDGSGIIDSSDWQEALDRAMDALPSGSPAGTNNDAPTASDFALMEVDDADIDVVLSLLSGFGDLESGSGGLVYSIKSISDPSLFDTISINQTTKELVVNAASEATGRATIVIRATDAGGLSVDIPVTVDVNFENQPPSIANLTFANAGAGTWIVSGDVSDPDDDVSNFLVQIFGDVFSIRSAVDENGHFEFSVVLDEEANGLEYAVVYDPHGAESNIPFGEIGMT
jgi:hypothetical protein